MGDIIKYVLIIVSILLIGLVSAYTPEQQILIDGMNLRCQLCTAYEKAIQGQNIIEYNNLVDVYNAWIQQHFGEGADALLVAKISPNLQGIAQKQATTTTKNPYYQTENPPGGVNPYAVRNPFNASSNLSKFGKQQVRTDLMGEAEYIEATTADNILKDFLAT